MDCVVALDCLHQAVAETHPVDAVGSMAVSQALQQHFEEGLDVRRSKYQRGVANDVLQVSGTVLQDTVYLVFPGNNVVHLVVERRHQTGCRKNHPASKSARQTALVP